MSDYPIKSASKEYRKASFYLVQSNGSNKRYVISLLDKTKIRIFLAGFINQSKNEIQVKIRDHDDQQNPIEYSGTIAIAQLHDLISKHEDVIFHNGYHDLMLRNPLSGEYLNFDDHGLLFVYTDQDYSEQLNSLNIEHKPNKKLIYEFAHYHYCLPHGKEKLASMIVDMELKKD